MPQTVDTMVLEFLVENKEATKRIQEQDKALQKSNETTKNTAKIGSDAGREVRKLSGDISQLGANAGPTGTLISGLMMTFAAGAGPMAAVGVAIGLIVFAMDMIKKAAPKTAEEMKNLSNEIGNTRQATQKLEQVFNESVNKNSERVQAIRKLAEIEKKLGEVKENEWKKEQKRNVAQNEADLLELKNNKKKGEAYIKRDAKGNPEHKLPDNLLNLLKEKDLLFQKQIDKQQMLLDQSKALLEIGADGVNLQDQQNQSMKTLTNVWDLATLSVKTLGETELKTHEEARQLQETLSEMRKEGIEKKKKQEVDDYIVALEKEIEVNQKKTDLYLESYRGLFTTIKSLATSMFDTLISGWTNGATAAQNFQNVLNDILKQVVSSGFQVLLSVLSGGLASGGGGLIGGLFGLLGLNKGGPVPGYATGGRVGHYASGGGVDTVPAMLTPGEYVINKNSSSQNPSSVSAINNGFPMDKALMVIGKMLTNKQNGNNVTFVNPIMTKEFTENQIIPYINSAGKRNSGKGYKVL